MEFSEVTHNRLLRKTFKIAHAKGLQSVANLATEMDENPEYTPDLLTEVNMMLNDEESGVRQCGALCTWLLADQRMSLQMADRYQVETDATVRTYLALALNEVGLQVPNKAVGEQTDPINVVLAIQWAQQVRHYPERILIASMQTAA